jgi:hypothetical protein
MACIVVAEVETIPGNHIISKLLCKPIGYSYILTFRIPKKFQGHQWTSEWCSTWSVQGVRGMGYTRIRSRHSRMSWTLLSYRYYLLMLRKTVWAQQIWMDKTAMEGRLVEVHPCGTPTQNMTQMLLLLYYAEIMYCMCSVSSIWL